MSEITSFPINTDTFGNLDPITDAQATDADGVLFFDESVGVMKRMTRGELFKGKVIPINSIADFAAIDVGALSNRQQFHLNSFSPTGSSGGGPLLWAPDKPKSLHDGIRYFSPTVPVPADYDNPTDVQNYMDGVGEEFPTADGIFELTLYSIQSSEFPAIDGAFVLWDGVSGNQVKNGVVPSAIGVNALQIPSITEVSYSRYNADESVSMRTLDEHKTDLLLNNVDNTSDADKPISTAAQTALDLKANSTDVTAALALKAPLASPALTGNPTAPTPSTGDNDTSIATTAFVQNELADRVQSVATIPAASALTGLIPGQVINVREFDTGYGFGGGDLVVVSGAITVNNMLTFTSATSGVYLQRINYTELDVTMAGVRVDGVLSDTALQTAVTVASGKSLFFPDGEYNFSLFPTGIDDVRMEGSSRIVWTDVKMPLFSGVFTGGLETALVSGVIRYYSASGGDAAGWYFLYDKGEDHDPILVGPITASGNFSQFLSVNFSDFGLDPALWTPSGVVVGPDDTLAKEGITVGASVGDTQIEIYGSFNLTSNTIVRYDDTPGSGWTYEGASGGLVTYTFTWNNDASATAYLRITRTGGARLFRPGTYLGSDFRLSPKVKTSGDVSGIPPYLPIIATQGVDGSGDTYVDVVFYDVVANTRLTTLDEYVVFLLEDAGAVNPQLRWQDIDDMHGNIWFTGTFVKKAGSVPPPEPPFVLPTIEDENSTFNDEGLATTGWTASNSTLSVTGSTLRQTKTSGGSNSSMSKDVTFTPSNSDYVFYGKIKGKYAASSTSVIWFLNGAKEVSLWLGSGNADTHTLGSISICGTTGASTRNVASVATGFNYETNDVEFCLQFDPKFTSLTCWLRQVDGTWLFGARVACDWFSATQVQLLTTTASPAGSWIEFDYLTLAEPNCLVIGDSIAEGKTLFSPNRSLGLTNDASTWMRYANYYPALRNNLIVNKGVGSQTSTAILARYSEATDSGARVVFLHLSSNDEAAGISFATRTSNTQSMINASIAASQDVVLLNSVYATEASSDNTPTPDLRDYMLEFWDDYKPTLTGVSAFINIMIPIEDDGFMDASLTQSDGIHPNPAGFELISDYIGS